MVRIRVRDLVLVTQRVAEKGKEEVAIRKLSRVYISDPSEDVVSFDALYTTPIPDGHSHIYTHPNLF